MKIAVNGAVDDVQGVIGGVGDVQPPSALVNICMVKAPGRNVRRQLNITKKP
jgi:hypothetical protein